MMMAKLINKTKNTLIANHVEEARTFTKRGIGLLGRKGLATDQTLWIDSCNSIHTWFMKFAIDVIFVDDKLTVKAIYENVTPWRLIWPVWSARSVFEMSSGGIKSGHIEVGDQLHVGD